MGVGNGNDNAWCNRRGRGGRRWHCNLLRQQWRRTRPISVHVASSAGVAWRRALIRRFAWRKGQRAPKPGLPRLTRASRRAVCAPIFLVSPRVLLRRCTLCVNAVGCVWDARLSIAICALPYRGCAARCAIARAPLSILLSPSAPPCARAMQFTRCLSRWSILKNALGAACACSVALWVIRRSLSKLCATTARRAGVSTRSRQNTYRILGQDKSRFAFADQHFCSSIFGRAEAERDGGNLVRVLEACRRS